MMIKSDSNCIVPLQNYFLIKILSSTIKKNCRKYSILFFVSISSYITVQSEKLVYFSCQSPLFEEKNIVEHPLTNYPLH